IEGAEVDLLQVFGNNGVLFRQIEFPAREIYLQDLPAGAYHIRLLDGQGRIAIQRIILIP
ncbi:MAG: hypothetical protein AAFY36_12420, partial [Bacteroidota bacterium]